MLLSSHRLGATVTALACLLGDGALDTPLLRGEPGPGPFTAPIPGDQGQPRGYDRNARCHCGSGKKTKKCCRTRPKEAA